MPETIPPHVKAPAHFWGHVNKTDTCWFWTGASLRKGYGSHQDTAAFGRKTVPAHRASYFYAYGPIPEGMLVCHRCDVPSCVRPDHLFLGTHADNRADAAKKGRVPILERHHNSKLTNKQVLDIRRLLSTGAFQREIARAFGISQSTVHAIKVGQNWRTLDV